MSRFLWLIPMLLALGLLASLAAPVTFASASSGEPSSNVLVAWPGWGVQQDLGSLSGTVGTFQIDVSAEPEADHVTLRASLVDAATLEVLRETLIEATPSYVPVSRTLEFPAYVVPSGQRLLLQLIVAGHERYHATFRLAYPQLHYANLMLNGVPDSSSGPLVFSHQETVSGLRAALHGAPSERLRLAVAVLSAALAGLAHPVAAAGLRRLRSRVMRLRRTRATLDRRRNTSALSTSPDAPVTIWSRLIAIPWYPLPVAAIPILHFLTSNPLHFTAREAVLPIIVALTVVTACVGCLQVILRDWHRSAAATAVVTTVFFAFGHVDGALDGRLDERALLGVAVVFVAAASAAIFYTQRRIVPATHFLNLASSVLIVFPLSSLAAHTVESAARTSRPHALNTDNLVAHLFPAEIPPVTVERPDIYYIILDAYVRADALEFDNSSFLGELERRGFYVASEATSNYTASDQSISSSLNMSYLSALHQRPKATADDRIDIARSHALGAVLKELGYTYVHLDSGFVFTDESPLADFHVKFTPAGTFIREGPRDTVTPYVAVDRSIVSSTFIRALMQTTALRSIIGQRLLMTSTEPYIIFTSPYRALKMFEFLTTPIDIGSPQFVFAHFGVPHPPSVFDRHGNYVVGDSSVGFSDSHDLSVPNAYSGEIIYINSLVVKMIDGILGSHASPPIIVIASDHGRDEECECPHQILAAFHLPHGGNSGLYPAISSVNHFRYILDYYFGFDLGLLDDVKIPRDS